MLRNKFKKVMSVVITGVSTFFAASKVVLADEASETIVKPINNLVSIVTTVAMAGGILYGLFEIIQLGIAIKSQDSSAKSSAVKGLVGAGIVAGAGTIVKVLFN